MTDAQTKANGNRESASANTRDISGRRGKASEHKSGLSNPASSVAKKEPKKSPDGRSKPTIVSGARKAGTRAEARSHEQKIVDGVEKTILEENIPRLEIELEKLFNLLKQALGRNRVSPHGGESCTNYQNKTVVELRRLLTERNVASDLKLKKYELKQALIDNDNKENSPGKIGKRGFSVASEGQESQIHGDQPLIDPSTGKLCDAQLECIDRTRNVNKRYRILVSQDQLIYLYSILVL